MSDVEKMIADVQRARNQARRDAALSELAHGCGNWVGCLMLLAAAVFFVSLFTG